MNQQFGRDQNRFQRQARDPGERSESGNAWQRPDERDERDEDGRWSRQRDDQWSRSPGDDQGSRSRGMDQERRFGSSSSGSEGGQRGYGRAIYGESGLGEPNRDERWGQGWSRAQPQSGGYGHGLSGYSPTDFDRDRFGSQREQGFRNRDFGGAGFSGRGPKDYQRTDERVREDVCDRLSRDDEVDASEISVRVANGEVTLEGSTETRYQKHRAEDIAADVSGVRDVHNNVRVRKSLMNEIKDKVTGQAEPTGGHADSGTKDTASSHSSYAGHNGR